MKLGKYKTSPVRKFAFDKPGCLKTFGHYNPDAPTTVFFGYADDPESLESATAKAAWLDEAGQKRFRLGSWEAILRRLSIAQGRALITTTPYDLGWLKQQIYDRWKAGNPDYDVIRFDSTENPNFPQEEFERAKRDLPRWKFDLFYRGIFTRPAGQIYDCFKHDPMPDGHLCPRWTLPEHWPRHVGLDFGGVNTAAVYFAEELREAPPAPPRRDPRGFHIVRAPQDAEKYQKTGRLFLYRTYKAGGRTAAEHARAIRLGEPQITSCVGGSLSEGQWRAEFRAGGLPVMAPPIKDVEVGINRVYGAHARGEIIVFDDLAEYLEQKSTYSRKLNPLGEPTEEIEDKATYHYCLTAGTLVTTDVGEVPIEDVRTGMMALTRKGYRRITDAWLTGTRDVKEVAFSNGAAITGTGDHPVWVKGKGFISIAELHYQCIVLHRKEIQCPAPKVSPSSSTESPTTAIPTPSRPQIKGILNVEESISTELSGSSTSVLSRTDGTCITGMETRRTTISATLRSSPTASTCEDTTPGTRPPPRMPILSVSDPSQANGTDRMREVPGIQNMPDLNVIAASQVPCKGPVRTAERNTRLSNLAGRARSAPTPVKLPSDANPAKTSPLTSANSADRSLSGIDSSLADSAPVSVQQVRDAGTAQVYNLTVDDAHEFFANGILVSNCDSERYVIAALRGGTIEAGAF